MENNYTKENNGNYTDKAEVYSSSFVEKESKFAQMSDEEIIYNHRDEPEAEEYILYKYKGFVKAMARRYFLIGGDADDLIQEGMIGLYKAIRDFNHEKNVSFKTCAELCVIRQMISAIKAANRLKHRPLNTFVSLNHPVFEEDGERTLEDMITDQGVLSPEELYIENECFLEFEKKMNNSLSKFELDVVMLYLEGRSYSYISKKLGKSVKSVDNALQRAKSKLSSITK